jgi:hypothetical protein
MLKILTIHDQQDSIGIDKILTYTVSLFKKFCRSINTNVNTEIIQIFHNHARATYPILATAICYHMARSTVGSNSNGRLMSYGPSLLWPGPPADDIK